MVEKWKTKNKTYLENHRIFQVRQDTAIRPWDKELQKFVVLECPNWVNVIPITPQKEVLMVRQFRHGAKEITLEIPGGMVDPEDKDPEIAGKRELVEETGAEGQEWLSLGSCCPNPAFQDNLCYHYLALGTEKTKEVNFDGNEQLEIVYVPLDKVFQYIDQGKITHSLVIAAFFRFQHWQKTTQDFDRFFENI